MFDLDALEEFDALLSELSGDASAPSAPKRAAPEAAAKAPADPAAQCPHLRRLADG